MKELPPATVALPPLPRHLDQVCDRFEAAWKEAVAGGVRPRQEDYLNGIAGPELQALLLELLGLEVGYRRQLGETPSREEYLQRFPGLPPEWLAHELAFCAGAGVGQEPATLGNDPSTPGVLPGRLGDYELLEEIARGGMGVVYKARQVRLNRIVALKMILGGAHAGHEAAVRFFQEAELIARLKHPNIVQVHEFGSHEGKPFFSLEFVEGGSLAARLQGQPQPARQTAELVETLARAIQTAHAQGIIHRDLKPANVLLTADGIPKITDFGVAKQAASGLTATDAVLGTPSYMAPEQAEGKTREVGPAADVYALGAILYEMLTGRPPFKAVSSWETVKQVLTVDPVPPRQLDPSLPRDLETICLKCLRKEPEQRYATALLLAEELKRFLAGVPILAHPVGRPQRCWRWCLRNPVIASLLAAVLALLLVVVVGTALAAWRLDREAARARSAERQANQRLLDASVAQAEASRSSLRPGKRFASLQALAQAADVARLLHKDPNEMRELRNAAIACLPLPDLRLEQEWEGNPPGTNGLALDARFERYAWSSTDGSIHIRRLADRKELLRLPLRKSDQPNMWHALLFSPGGRFLAVWYYYSTGPRPLEVWDLTAEAKEVCPPIPDVTGFPDFTADDSTLAVGLPDGSLDLYDLVTGQKKKSLAAGWLAERLKFSPDGKRLAVASKKKPGVQIRDLSSGSVQKLPHRGGVGAVAWHPSGHLLATGCEDKHVYLWDTQTGKQQADLEGHYWEVHDLAFDRDGGRLLSFGWDMTVRWWDTWTHRQLVTLSEVRALNFSQGEQLRVAVLKGRQVQLWDCVPSSENRVLHGPQTTVHDVAFSPDSRWLAAGSKEEAVWLWDAVTAQQVARVPHREVEFLWNPAGDSLTTYSWRHGVRHWPIRPHDHEGAAGIQIGPPRTLLAPADDSSDSRGRMCWCGLENKWLAINGYHNDCLSLIQTSPAREVSKGRQPRAVFIAASPDGRWVATGTFEGGRGVCVWEAATGKCVQQWDIGDADVAFSPDGRWLAVGTGRLATAGAECLTYRVGSWELQRRIPLPRTSSAPAPLTFTRDGTLLAVAASMGVVQLLQPDTLEEVAVLTAPEPLLITKLASSPDGSQLAAAASNSVQLWDLRAIRRQLKSLGLDWDAPDYPPEPPGNQTPLRIEVVP